MTIMESSGASPTTEKPEQPAATKEESTREQKEQVENKESQKEEKTKEQETVKPQRKPEPVPEQIPRRPKMEQPEHKVDVGDDKAAEERNLDQTSEVQAQQPEEGAKKENRKISLAEIVLLLTVVLVVCVVACLFIFEETIMSLIVTMIAMFEVNPGGGLVVTSLLTIVTCFPFIFGHEIVGIFIGMMFLNPMYGFLVAYVASIVGSMVAFNIVKMFGNIGEDDNLSNQNLYAAVQCVEGNPILCCVMLRLSLLPCGIVNSIVGLAKTDTIVFFVGSVCGFVVVLFPVLFGNVLFYAYTYGDTLPKHTVYIWFVVVGLIIQVVCSVFMWGELGEMEEETDEVDGAESGEANQPVERAVA